MERFVDRPSWKEYFHEMAQVASKRSVCIRSKCGAVIVKDKNIISTGYNGAPAWQPNCQEIGFCYREKHGIESGTNLEKCRACGSHAESNAISLAAKHGNSTKDTIMFVHGNTEICTQCRAMIANAGIIKVYHRTKKYETRIHDVTKWNVHPLDTEDKK